MSISTQINNIIQTLNHCSRLDYTAGLQWYTDASNFSKTLALKYSLSKTETAGIIAVLSPAITWTQNKKDAISIIENGNSAVVTTYPANKIKALKILAGAATLDILGGQKVLAFYDNILNPKTSTAVTIDRHAIRVARANNFNPDKQRLSPKQYRHLSIAYTLAGQIVGLKPLQIQAITWIAYRTKIGEKR